MKIRQAARYIDNSDNPIITALGIKFLEASTDKVQAVAKANNKTYTSLRAASNEGMSYKKLKPAIEGAMTCPHLCVHIESQDVVADNGSGAASGAGGLQLSELCGRT